MPTQTKAPRRVGAETSKTRLALLDAVERLMLEQGYAAVTYRRLAAEAEVTPALVQYYFPTLDDLLLATLRRRVDGHVERLAATLRDRPDEPLRVIWEFSNEEAMGALMLEYVALGNHRKSIGAEIGQVAERVRQVELEAIQSIPAVHRQIIGELSAPALLVLLTGMPKLLRIEASLGVLTAHGEVRDAFESYLDLVEPRVPPRRRRKS
jgi:AcrR family transcriptional regulator